MHGFLHERMPQHITSQEYKSSTTSCYLPRYITTGNKITSHLGELSLMWSLENVQRFLAGCSALAQTKYLQRHNNALKILLFEVLRSLDLVTKVEPWYLQVKPKPLYEKERAIAYYDVPLYADTMQAKANRIDITILNKPTRNL